MTDLLRRLRSRVLWRVLLSRYESLSLDSQADRETLVAALVDTVERQMGIPLGERVRDALATFDAERLIRDLDALRVALERARAERDGWTETAAQQQRNTDYYGGLLDRIARHFGAEACRSEDGLEHEAPLRAKVPDLVDRLKGERDEAVAALAESDRGRTDQLRIIMGLRARLEAMETLIAAAAPLAWAHGVDPDGAHEWEKQAEALLVAETKADGR